MRFVLTVLLICAPVSASAQVYYGQATAIDGDTIDMTGQRIRLHGIDAPEAKQTCERSGDVWRCGESAGKVLSQLIDGRTVACEHRDRDVYGRAVAVCSVGQMDLARALVGSGLAVVLPNGQADYGEDQERAMALSAGLWAGTFQRPAEYRDANPAQFAKPKARDAAPVARTNRSAGSSVYYRSCAEARAAGAAPIYRGQPGYRTGMDGDGDGIACEPYRGRR